MSEKISLENISLHKRCLKTTSDAGCRNGFSASCAIDGGSNFDLFPIFLPSSGGNHFILIHPPAQLSSHSHSFFPLGFIGNVNNESFSSLEEFAFHAESQKGFLDTRDDDAPQHFLLEHNDAKSISCLLIHFLPARRLRRTFASLCEVQDESTRTRASLNGDKLAGIVF
jgi:hypothetical protein